MGTPPIARRRSSTGVGSACAAMKNIRCPPSCLRPHPRRVPQLRDCRCASTARHARAHGENRRCCRHPGAPHRGMLGAGLAAVDRIGIDGRQRPDDGIRTDEVSDNDVSEGIRINGHPEQDNRRDECSPGQLHPVAARPGISRAPDCSRSPTTSRTATWTPSRASAGRSPLAGSRGRSTEGRGSRSSRPSPGCRRVPSMVCSGHPAPEPSA